MDLEIASVPSPLTAHQLLLECDPARGRLDFAVAPAAPPASWATEVAFGATIERLASHVEWALGDPAHAAKLRTDSWIEYDVDPASHRAALAARASGFIGLPNAESKDVAAVGRLVALLANDGDLLSARTEAAEWTSALERELAPLRAVQAHQAVRYLGRMDARGTRSVRIHAGPVRAEAVARWREWPAALAPALAAADWLVLGFDLERSGAGPRWGLELVCTHETRHNQRYRPMLDALVSAGVLPAGIVPALATWTGATCEADAADAWLPTLLGGPGAFYHVRTLNHVKLVFTPGAPPTAKVYLAVDRSWLGGNAHPERTRGT